MKCDRIKLAAWLGDLTDGYVDIPWPQVHEQAGAEQINWLLRQDPMACQMIMDKEQDGALRSLWAEFYNESLRLQYAIKFGK
jgi:hypothetical protein